MKSYNNKRVKTTYFSIYMVNILKILRNSFATHIIFNIADTNKNSNSYGKQHILHNEKY